MSVVRRHGANSEITECSRFRSRAWSHSGLHSALDSGAQNHNRKSGTLSPSSHYRGRTNYATRHPPCSAGDEIAVSEKNQPNLLDELAALFSRFLALNSGLPLVLALWTLATHLHEVFDAFPYLAITSPTKRCGKTRLCELLGLICFQPLQTVSISSAALYRLLRAGKRTLLIDEAEYLTRRNDERASILREILNAGYRKGQSVWRCKQTTTKKGRKESVTNYEPEPFDTYCPKALVLIGQLQDTLGDRCIEIRMERRGGAQLERFRLARVQEEIAPMQKQLGAWAKDNAGAVQAYYHDNDLPFLGDREAELWLPLFSVCQIAAPQRVTELQVIATRLADLKSRNESGEWGIQLLSDVRELFGSENDRLPTSELLYRLNSLEESPWAGWSNGRGLNSHFLARLLRPFGIHPQNVRCGEQVVKGYMHDSFEDAWQLYL